MYRFISLISADVAIAEIIAAPRAVLLTGNEQAIRIAKAALDAAAAEPARIAAQATLDRQLEYGRRLDAERAYKSLATKNAGSVGSAAV